MPTPTATTAPVVLVTGAARRIGAAIARQLHAQGYRVIVHYHRSQAAAQKLCDGLNALRADSATCLPADLCAADEVGRLARQAVDHWGRLDALVNNASSFYPTPLAACSAEQWEDLLGSNLKAPFFLIQALTPALRQAQGAVVNLVDIHAQRPLQGYPIYSIAKAGLAMLTQSLAKELAPEIRVNGVAPGPILWPEAAASLTPQAQAELLQKVPLARQGTPEEIARSVEFLLQHPYISGQILAVDGGKSLYS